MKTIIKKMTHTAYVILLLATTSAFAQSSDGFSLSNDPEYRTSIGMRLIFDGPTPCLGVKHFISPTSAIEGLILFPENAFAIEGLYEYQQAFSGAKGFYWYGGAGLLLLFPDSEVGDTEAFFGLPFIIGLEYKITGAPIVVGFDWQPLIWLSDVVDRFNAKQVGLTVRLAFK